MGYTHYFPLQKAVAKGKRKAIISDMRKIEEHFKSNGLPLFDGRGDKKGVVYNDAYFAFNGDGSKGESHETFYIDFDDTDFNFCKTARKPYDLAVTTTLIMLVHHLGSGIEVSGDGFLYNMVRIIAGTFIEVGLGRFSPEYINDIIISKDRRKAGRTAPACGLYMVEVYY